MAPPTTNTPTTSSVEPLKVVLGIVANQMALTAAQWATANQDYAIPPAGLFLVGGYLGPTEVISSTGYFDPATNAEVQQMSCRHTIQLELMSMAPDNSARIRKEELPLALRSFYSQQQQNVNQIGIAWMTSDIIDASAPEGTVMLNRFITTIAVNALHSKTIAAGYLGIFPLQLTAESQDGRGATVSIDTSKTPTGR